MGGAGGVERGRRGRGGGLGAGGGYWERGPCTGFARQAAWLFPWGFLSQGEAWRDSEVPI